MIQQPSGIKLMIVVPTLTCGGVERNVSVICNHIDTTKYDVTLVVLNNANQFFPINNSNIRIIDLGISRVRRSLFSVLKLAKEIKPGILLSTANHQNILFAIFKGFFPKQTKIIARESSIVSINNKRAPNPWLYDRISKLFYKRIDMIICQSTYMQEDLQKNYAVKASSTCIIPNAVTVPELNSNPAKDNIPALITVARLSSEKGIDRLIRSVALLKTPYRFFIIGEGDKRNDLQHLIDSLSLNDRVFLLGSRQDPFTAVEDPALFLMGSHFEGFPNAMLESIAAGIPVVAFNAPGGIQDILIDQENGMLVKEDNEKAFAATVEKALTFNFDKARVQQSVLGRFNINIIMREWEEIFDSIK